MNILNLNDARLIVTILNGLNHLNHLNGLNRLNGARLSSIIQNHQAADHTGSSSL